MRKLEQVVRLLDSQLGNSLTRLLKAPASVQLLCRDVGIATISTLHIQNNQLKSWYFLLPVLFQSWS